MNHDTIIQGALMPDAHTGYTLPIGGVVASKDMIFPAFVGYDIGCGMSGVNLGIKKYQIDEFKDKIFNSIYRTIPTGFAHNNRNEIWEYEHIDRTTVLDSLMKRNGLNQLSSLGGGNHFIEIAYDENDDIWIVIHSGSRGIGHDLASKYMQVASLQDEEERKKSIL